MHPIDRARNTAIRMRSQQQRDWPAHWLGLLEDPTTSMAVRRFAYQALRNLGHSYREPGSDDE